MKNIAAVTLFSIGATWMFIFYLGMEIVHLQPFFWGGYVVIYGAAKMVEQKD